MLSIVAIASFVFAVICTILLQKSSNELKMLHSALEKEREYGREADSALIEAKALVDCANESLDELSKEKVLNLQVNQDLQKQREDAWAMYHEQAILAGNAQSMLVNVLQRAIAEVNTYRKEKGKKLMSLDPRIKETVDTFKERHIDSV